MYTRFQPEHHPLYKARVNTAVPMGLSRYRAFSRGVIFGVCFGASVVMLIQNWIY